MDTLKVSKIFFIINRNSVVFSGDPLESEIEIL